MKKTFRNLPAWLLFSVLASFAALPALAESGGGVQRLFLSSGAGRDSAFVSVNASFSTSAGPRNLVMYGLREAQKEPLLAALSQSYDPKGTVPLKIEDPAFADAEKYDADSDLDSALCWAASVSNILWMSGWAGEYTSPRSGKPFASEDEVFDYYFSKFTNLGIDNIAGAVDWFFMGEFYNLTYSRGAELHASDPADGLRKDFISSRIQERLNLLRNPQQMEALEQYCDWTKDGASVFEANIGSLFMGEAEESEHAVTVAGIITDPAAASWEDRYQAILIIDSDDDASPTEAERPEEPGDAEMLASRASRPNAVTVYPLKYRTDSHNRPVWQVMGYGEPSAEWIIFSVNRLRLRDPAFYDQFRETEGTRDVIRTADLTLERLFTTDRTEALRDMYMVEEDEVIVNVFRPGAPVSLNFFIANRSSETSLNEETRQGKTLSVSWSVMRDTDRTEIASGRSACEGNIDHGLEAGFLVCLNEKDGQPQSWPEGTYTVRLEVNPDHEIPEAYYGNNLPKEYSFEIR